ncbi:hypothetical protein HME9302_02594 [Alteripontixanthobacter maritimus]|uniref:Uncharacterized protein n=1 Tax=Alteripontixanthobacter maritimus TaxID=2161824 RepID=A0A369QA81_9SPHN|nr:hypothetical protein [Alteripontixanthobacter maritimus]RDC61372.1 hypothetical protein HME9302_02594 [Alteripontixanthobacter maritimus]
MTLTDLVAMRGTFQLLAVLTLALVAWRRGGSPEKISAGVLLGVLLLDRFYHFILTGGKTIGFEGTYWQVDIGHVVIDVAALAIILAITLRANRIYPLCLTALQLITVASHFSRVITPVFEPGAFALMSLGPVYMQIATLGIGLASHMRHQRIHGAYRSWRASSVR